MKRQWLAPVLKAVSALLAGILGLMLAMNLIDTEAGGGRLTGPLIQICPGGSLLLLLCAALAFTRRAIVAVLTLVASLACLPLFLYRVAPSLLSWVSQAPASAAPGELLTFDPMAVGGLIAIGFLALVHVRLPDRAGVKAR